MLITIIIAFFLALFSLILEVLRWTMDDKECENHPIFESSAQPLLMVASIIIETVFYLIWTFTIRPESYLIVVFWSTIALLIVTFFFLFLNSREEKKRLTD